MCEISITESEGRKETLFTAAMKAAWDAKGQVAYCPKLNRPALVGDVMSVTSVVKIRIFVGDNEILSKTVRRHPQAVSGARRQLAIQALASDESLTWFGKSYWQVMHGISEASHQAVMRDIVDEMKEAPGSRYAAYDKILAECGQEEADAMFIDTQMLISGKQPKITAMEWRGQPAG